MGLIAIILIRTGLVQCTCQERQALDSAAANTEHRIQ